MKAEQIVQIATEIESKLPTDAREFAACIAFIMQRRFTKKTCGQALHGIVALTARHFGAEAEVAAGYTMGSKQ